VTGRPWWPDGDGGTSLVEVMATMTIMVTVGAIFTGSIVQVYRSANVVESRAEAQAQIGQAYLRLDREIRYAYGISTPSTPEEAAAASGTWYVEYLRIDSGTGAAHCDQLRMQGGVLMLRQWTPGSPPATSQGGGVLASSIDMSSFATASAAGAMVPFELQAAGSAPYASPAVGSAFSPDSARLRLRLVTLAGGQRRSSDITFTAMNTTRTGGSTATGPTADQCRAEGRS
jgi:hypothetical protein